MGASNFSEDTLDGGNLGYQKAVDDLQAKYGFDFVALGLTAFLGAPLMWVYGAGATNMRYRRIVLTPGRGIGGIVIKSGKPMMFTDIDRQIDPREYSSYPIVFAEDLHSFCALPLLKGGRVVGALLCAFRSVAEDNRDIYDRFIAELTDSFCDLSIVSTDFMYMEEDFAPISVTKNTSGSNAPSPSSLSPIINAQEDERRRISRELHDGIAQELVSTTFILKRIDKLCSDTSIQDLIAEAEGNIETALDQIHNLSVELRPSALDNLGLIPALKSQAAVFGKTYGAQVVFSGRLSHERFDRALETQVYRICQEAILNACKYSGNAIIRVTFEEMTDWIHISVADEGRGFDTANPRIKGSGCGLIGMQERASLIGASLQISSTDRGTTVTLVAPMGRKEDAADDPDSACR